MAEFRTVARAAEIPPGEMKLVDLEGKEVVVANVEGRFYAFDNVCTHAEGPLAEGELNGDEVTCPWHSTIFNVRSGEPQGGPGEKPVATYEVNVEGDEIRLRAQ